MRRIKKMLFVLAFVLSTISAYSQFSGGDGTEGNPYQVSTATELDSVRAYADANFILMNDIDLTDYLTDGNPGYNGGNFWEPIGNDADKFTGDFNGNDLKISGLKINRPAQDYIGLFGSIDAGIIYDLSVEIDTVSEVKGNAYTGGLAGKIINSSIINCQITGSVSGNYNVGGLIGWNESNVTESRSYTNIIGNNQTGGLIGVNSSGIVTNCHSNVTVTASGVMSGGLIGQQYNGEITQCSSAGTVNSTFSECGGLIGWAEYFTISKCFSSVNINVDGSSCTSIGGFVGSANGSSSETITECYATGNVLTNCNGYVGGFAGYLNCSVSKSYSVGQVTGTAQIGGFIGDYAGGASTGRYCYWDTERSGLSVSDGGVGKTTAEMKLESTYTDWDFDFSWIINPAINDGYPFHPNSSIDTFTFAGGDGTSGNPYQVSTAEHLNYIRYTSGAYFILNNDIDLTAFLTEPNLGYNEGQFWRGIGGGNHSFTGYFDGNNKKISGLKINRPLRIFVGLFGLIIDSEIKDLSVEIDTLSNITGYDLTGGIVGVCENSSITNCFTSGSVISTFFRAGGIAGGTSNSCLIKCGSSGNIGCTSGAGGLVGGCTSTEVVECFSNADVTGASNLGGLVGSFDSCPSVIRSYSSGTVTGTTNYIGGLAGYALSSVISNCYSKSSVSGSAYVGGLLGVAESSSATNCYSAGAVSGTVDNIGGLVGNNGLSTITGCYWDTETSGQAVSAGGEGRTTAEMKSIDTYTGWDFTTPVWIINTYNNGYPWLDWQGLTGIEEESSIPEVTALHQNYPNPFNPTTEIIFDLNKDSDVNLSVYNSNGQLVKELVKDNLSAGYHNVTFDAAGLNSGLYFYRLNYGDKAITKKMILVK